MILDSSSRPSFPLKPAVLRIFKEMSRRSFFREEEEGKGNDRRVGRKLSKTGRWVGGEARGDGKHLTRGNRYTEIKITLHTFNFILQRGCLNQNFEICDLTYRHHRYKNRGLRSYRAL